MSSENGRCGERQGGRGGRHLFEGGVTAHHRWWGGVKIKSRDGEAMSCGHVDMAATCAGWVPKTPAQCDIRLKVFTQ